jgi:hypothetical protein
MLIGLDTSLRYLCPVIIAAAPSAMIIAATSVSEVNAQIDTQRLFVKKPIFVVAFFSLLVLGFFSASFIERVKQAAAYGSILSFGPLVRNPQNIEYNHYVFSKDAKEKVQTANTSFHNTNRWRHGHRWHCILIISEIISLTSNLPASSLHGQIFLSVKQ